MLTIFFIALGLSADAFAVSVTNGLSLKDKSRKQALKIAAAFGIFQALMPLFGFLLGSAFKEFIESFAHWIAFIFLGFIGVKMLIDEVCKKDGDAGRLLAAKPPPAESLSSKTLLMQAIATSIDALVVGISFIAMGITGFMIFPCIAIIGATTFVLSFLGVDLGKKFGKLLGGRAKIIGGIVLIVIGVKVLAEGLLA
jgi:putative Mn2+ efflux pump MntP